MILLCTVLLIMNIEQGAAQPLGVPQAMERVQADDDGISFFSNDAITSIQCTLQYICCHVHEPLWPLSYM